MTRFSTQIILPFLNTLNKFGDRNAFCIKEQYYTYTDFSRCVSKIRVALRNVIFNNPKVGLVINDDIETYASIFALWLEGCCYVPLHPNWPSERCLDICEQVASDLVLDSSEVSRYDNVKVLNTSMLLYEHDCLEPNIRVADEELAYILFTSGSTGTPKGVMLSRGNVAAFMDSFWKTGIKVDESDLCLQAFDLSFDVSVQGYLVPLTKGACCYTIPYGQIKYVYASGLIEDHKITFGAMAPSMLRYLKPYFNEIDATSLKTCILTAEACPLDLMEEWWKCAPNTELYDFYGPTECTIYCTYFHLVKGGNNKTLNGIISIGKPLANCNGLILDEKGNELPAGEKGELCISGAQVTKGYWKNDEKNKSCFFMKEVDGIPMRFYHTGDLCYKDENGDIMYSGRLDYQTKIQGFRVEMGEIEYHAHEFLAGKNVICMAFNNKDGLTEIAMFVESYEIENARLVAYLKNKMPSYMIPSKILYVPAFPINENGKIDKNSLRQMIS